jgi:class 3 adenylate cyclase
MRGLAIGIGILVLSGFGAGATELSLAMGQPADAPLEHSAAKPSLSVKPSPSATPITAASPSPTASPTPNLPTAVTNGFVHMRAGTSTGTAIVANLNAGSIVYLTGQAIGIWQPVIYQGLNGYIYTPYLNY